MSWPPHMKFEQRPPSSCLRSGGHVLRCLWTAGLLLILVSVPGWGAQVRVREGTLVRLKLHYDLTTENVDKGDRVDFDVADNIVVNNHVVIPKGAVAWGQVTRVKGQGKKRAKDASVTFRFVGVRSADNQEIPLRLLPYKSKKSDTKENEIEESSAIPGLCERMIGAEKGKEYAAYTDTEALINAPEVTQTAAAAPAASSPAAPTPGGSPAQPAAAQPAPPASLLGPEQASIDFTSTPSGADIVIDGGFVGNTPSTLRIAPGRHTIELRMAGYRSWTRNMLVGPGSHPSIRATLEKE